MKDELVRKIWGTLAGNITSESQLVYFLVEVRKLMDRDGYEDPALRSFSNWVVHTELGKRGDGTTELLEEFDEAIRLSVEGNSGLVSRVHQGFDNFCERLRIFLDTYALPTELTDDFNLWFNFARLYAGVVSDCPIKFKASKTELKYIAEIELRCREEQDDDTFSSLEWKVTLKTGEVQRHTIAFLTWPRPQPKSL